MPEEQIAAPETVENKIGIELLEALLKPENTSAYVPNQLTGKGRKNGRKIFQNVYNILNKIVMQTGQNEQSLRKTVNLYS